MNPRLSALFGLVGGLLLAAGSGGAAPGQKVELAELLARLQPVATNQARQALAPAPQAHYSLSTEGHVRWLSAPSGHAFAPDAALVAGDAVATARGYLRANGSVFGIASGKVNFVFRRTRDNGNRKNIRLQQIYAGVPVFGGEAVVQLNAAGGIEAVMNRTQRDTSALDDGSVTTVPQLSAAAAVARAQAHFSAEAGEPVTVGPADLQIFAPGLLQMSGPLRLVWKMEVAAADPFHLNKQVLVDAATGEIAATFELNCTALNRVIQDKQNNNTNAPVVVRVEGGAATGVAQLDNAYLYVGDTYNFYTNLHGRDSYNDAGAPIIATLRYCDTNQSCPMANAFSGSGAIGSPMIFGDFWAVDEVVAHEYTHKVTANESDLIYNNASGAINESLSDIWGEFVDLSNGRGNDAANMRWVIGEDLLPPPGGPGPIRNMKFPTNLFDPDRISSPYFQPPALNPNASNDNGGVHKNSGVNNKLCYLLTDGDTFNGQTVYGMGVTQVVQLYYEAQINLLTSAADWPDLFFSLMQASVNLHWSDADQNNLLAACTAVEIALTTSDYWVDMASACSLEQGAQTCVSNIGPFKTVQRGISYTPRNSVLHIRAGNYLNQTNTILIEKNIELRAEGGAVLIGTP